MSDRALNWNNCLEYIALSDVGMRRSNNQDSHGEALAGTFDAWRQRGHVFVVADGMGAHAAGELASKLAVDNVTHLYRVHQELSPPEALHKAIHEANFEIHRRGEANDDFHQMGTTCSTLVLLPQGALVAHVGDSRVYRLRGDKFEQLTFDHSLVWEMREAHKASGTPMAAGIPRNVITRSLGPKAHVQVDMEGPFPLQPGDTFLLCSDGLSGLVKDEEMGAVLANLPPAQAVRLLVDLANMRGGHDNITVTVVRVTGSEMCPGEHGSEPLVIGPKAPQPLVPLASLLMTGVCGLAALLFLALGLEMATMGAAILAMLSLTWCLIGRFGLNKGEVTLESGSRLGKGPYVRTSSALTEPLIEELNRHFVQLSGTAQEDQWNINVNALTSLALRAEKARSAGQLQAALADYAKALAPCISEWHVQRKKKKLSDSSVDL